MIDLVESSYRLDAPKQAWLDEVGAQARASLWPGGCAIVLSYKGVHTPGLRRNGAAIVALDDRLRADAVALDPWVGPILDTIVHLGPLAGLASRLLPPAAAAELRAHLGRRGYVDVLGLVAHSGDGQAIGLTTPVREARPVTPAERTRFMRLGAHIGAAMRLRQRLHAQPHADSDQVAAVLAPDGKIVDARGAVAGERAQRQALTDAVLHMERARGGLRRSDPDRALEVWRGLVRGSWSLVESVERDGRRYLLAHDNGVGMADPRALSPREQAVIALARTGASNKAVGYALGLSTSTVGGYLASAMRKLRLGTRAELIALEQAPVGYQVGRVPGLELLEAPAPALDSGRLEALTPSEREIAEATARGLSNAAIARARDRSERTIANQLAAIFRKCGVGSRAELAALMTRA